MAKMDSFNGGMGSNFSGLASTNADRTILAMMQTLIKFSIRGPNEN